MPISRLILRLCLVAGLAVSAAAFSATSRAADKPNILWITSEDNGPELGCYGDTYADTPNLDALAERSLRYKRFWSNAPVCAPARTTIIAGMYATSLGGHHMRSGVEIPDDVTLYPKLMREAGYYCTNNSKTDYNFTNADAGWNNSSNKAHWRGRPGDDTPFFSIFNFTTSHESRIRRRPHTLKHDPAAAPIPAYHPDTPEVRRDWAQYYDKLTEMDAQVGKVLEELEADGLADSTIIFYYGDHGSGMPRSKRWPFDSGLHVPLIVHFPEKYRHLAPGDYEPGAESARLAAFVDLAPTLLSLAGVEPPEFMQGIAFAGQHEGREKDYLFGYRGRMDERIDMVRTCTDGRYVYMRHFYPDRPYLKHVNYMFQTPTTRVWKEMFDAGELNEAQAKFWQPKPVEELFDLENDPDEVINLAGKPEHAERVATMRNVLKNWMVDTGDLGVLPEAMMRRRSGEKAPRMLFLNGQLPMQRLVDLAFDAMDVDSDLSVSDLIEISEGAEDDGLRFWAVRGLDRRLRADSKERDQDSILDALKEATNDEAPSVVVAACDALLSTSDSELIGRATSQLLELANVETQGRFVPVAALNVLDIHEAKLDAEARAKLAELPRQEKKRYRDGGYAGRLLEYMTGNL